MSFHLYPHVLPSLCCDSHRSIFSLSVPNKINEKKLDDKWTLQEQRAHGEIFVNARWARTERSESMLNAMVDAWKNWKVDRFRTIKTILTKLSKKHHYKFAFIKIINQALFQGWMIMIYWRCIGILKKSSSQKPFSQKKLKWVWKNLSKSIQ